MAWVAALIGAAGAIGGSALGQQDAPSPGYVPGMQENPLFQQLMLMSQLGLGQPVNRAQLRQGSPLGTLLNSAQSIGLKRKGVASLSRAMDDIYGIVGAGGSAAEIAAQLKSSDFLARYGKGNGTSRNLAALTYSKIGGDVFTRLAAASGYGSLEELIQAELDFNRNLSEREGRYNEVAGVTEQGRLDALRSIAGIQSDFVAPSEADITTRSGEIENILRAQIEREFGTRREQSLHEANRYGINPAGRLQYMDESQALANLGAGPDALARTLQLLGGQQGLQSNALLALQGSLGAQDQSALSVLGLQQGSNNLAVQQALGLAQLQGATNTANGQLWAQGLQGVANQLGSIPGLLDEQNRRNQLDQSRRGLDSSINPQYGISTPGQPATNQEWNAWLARNG